MARAQSIGIRHVLKRFLPQQVLTRLATEAGVGQRRRKVRPHALFWTLVLGFGAGRERSLAGLRRAFERATRTTLAPSAFYDRFTPQLARFLRAVAVHLLGRVAEPVRAPRGPLAAFRDVVAADATVIRLHDLLQRAFKACRTNHTLAALKLHTVISVLGRGPRSVKITAERVHDGPVLRVGKWVEGRLLLFDLAYFRFQLFSCIRRNGGFFIVRLKKSADPVVVGLHRRWRGRAVPMLGRRVSEFVDRLQRQVIDAEVEVNVRRRAYAGVRHTDRERFRLVGVRDPATGEHHLYLTNIPPEKLSAEDVAQTYAARWAIELFFRELKRRYRIDDMPSTKRHIVEALVWAALITLIVSRELLAWLRHRLGQRGGRVPEERWAGLFAEVAGDLLRLMLAAPTVAALLTGELEVTLLHEAVDPNLGRALLLQRIEARCQFRHRVALGGAHA
jgi:putative transposase